tara:strand:- start:1977 stop:3695 length:1719 start_codon:yes stop_codon:yes gene_type:complete
MEKVTIEVDADVKDALEKLGAIEKGIKDVGDSSKKQTSAIKSLANGFKGVGLAMKAAGFSLIQKVVNALTDGLMKNQQIADAVSTAFNTLGVIFGKISNTIVTIVNLVSATGDNFDALGRIINNLLTLAVTPLKLAFNGVALVIKEVQLAWEKSFFGAKDVDRIASLTESITGYKQAIKDAAEDAKNASIGVVVDFKEGIGEIHNIGKVVVEEFNNTFKDVTVSSLVEQGKAVTKATNNLGLLQAKHREIIIDFETAAEKQRQIRDDITQSIDDRIAANEKLKQISLDQADAEIKALEDQKGAIRKQMDVEVDNADLKAELAELDNAIKETEIRKTQLQNESITNTNALLQEQKANKLELEQIGKTELQQQIEQINAEKERLLQLAQVTITNEEEKNAKLLAIKEQFQGKIDKLNKDEKLKQDAIDEKELADKKALEDAKRQAVQSGLQGIAALVGESSKAGKAIAVANATIDTFVGANKAIGQGGLIGVASAVGIIATGLANVRTILQTDIPGETGGGDNPPTPELPNAEPIVPTFGAIETDAPPVQAFVVESDVSSSQALQNDLNLQATL